jgi:hypothetical protein
VRADRVELPPDVVMTVGLTAGLTAGMTAGQLTDGRLIVEPTTAPIPGLRSTRLDPAVIMAGCLVFAIVMFLPSILNDADTLWHIRAGAWILEHRAIPWTDPFSFTAGDRPWFTIEWFSEVLMALAFRLGGMQGIMALTAGAVGLTAALLLHHLRRFLPGCYALLGTFVALLDAEPSLFARPHLLAWPCLVLWCGGLAAARANRTAPSFALLPVMLLWVNLHGSFMAGLLLAGGFMLEALCEAGADRRRVLRTWGAFILAAWAVALLNPNFLAGELFPFHVINMKSNLWITEWRPPDFSSIGPLELTLLGGLALGFSGKVRLPPVRLLMLLGLVHGALSHGRNEQLLGIVGALILAEPLGATLARGGAEASGVAVRRLAAAASVVAVAALVGRMVLPLSPERSGAAFAEVLGRVPPSVRTRPVLNAYDLGGALIFNGVRPFIDGRAADLYGDAFVTRYASIEAADRGTLQRTLSEYGIVWAVFPSGSLVIQMLEQETGWARLADMNGIVIDVRKDQLADFLVK